MQITKTYDISIRYQQCSDGLLLLVDMRSMASQGLKLQGEGEWKRKKYQPEYYRQWRKLHIGIDAETLQIRLFSSPQTISVMHKYAVIYLIKFNKMNGFILSIPMALMTQNTADKLCLIGRLML